MVLLVEIALERIELPPPEAAILGDPVSSRLERLGREPAAPLAPDLVIEDEPRPPEHTHVLEEGGERHPVRLRQLAHRRLPVLQPLEHRPAHRVGQRGEGAVQGRRIVNHSVYHCRTIGLGARLVKSRRARLVRTQLAPCRTGSCSRAVPEPRNKDLTHGDALALGATLLIGAAVELGFARSSEPPQNR